MLELEIRGFGIAMEQMMKCRGMVPQKQAALSSAPVMMQQSLNKLTGQVEWNVVHFHEDQDHGTGATSFEFSFNSWGILVSAIILDFCIAKLRMSPWV